MKTILPDTWGVPSRIRDRFGDTAGRQRAMFEDGHLVLVLHEPPGPEDLDRKARILWRSPSGTWSCNTDGCVTNLLKKHVESFVRRSEELEGELQAASCAADYFNLLQAIAPLHRASRNLHTTLQQAREMVTDDHEIIVARDAANEVERVFELLQVDAKNGLDYTVAHKAELQSAQSLQMARSSHRLNVLAALFFPITAISSVFGMNFGSGLEALPHPWVFWGVLSTGFCAGLMLVRSLAPDPGQIDKIVTSPPLPQSKNKHRERRSGLVPRKI